MSGLPDGATIEQATLAIANSTAPATGQELRGYAGDGAITVTDIEVDGTPVPLATSTTSRTTVDVKSLLTPAVVGSDWAGLSLRHESSSDKESWECLLSHTNYPILTVEYTVP